MPQRQPSGNSLANNQSSNLRVIGLLKALVDTKRPVSIYAGRQFLNCRWHNRVHRDASPCRSFLVNPWFTSQMKMPKPLATYNSPRSTVTSCLDNPAANGQDLPQSLFAVSFKKTYISAAWACFKQTTSRCGCGNLFQVTGWSGEHLLLAWFTIAYSRPLDPRRKTSCIESLRRMTMIFLLLDNANETGPCHCQSSLYHRSSICCIASEHNIDLSPLP